MARRRAGVLKFHKESGEYRARLSVRLTDGTRSRPWYALGTADFDIAKKKLTLLLAETAGIAPSPRDELDAMPPLAMGPDGLGVYFIYQHGLVKIGWSGAVYTRLRNGETFAPEMRLLAVLLGKGATHEDRLHEKFKRARWKGEWFMPTQSMVDMIRAARRGLPLASQVPRGPTRRPS